MTTPSQRRPSPVVIHGAVAIAALVPAINALRRAEDWDLVVFTLDWLPASMQRAFCLEDQGVD